MRDLPHYLTAALFLLVAVAMFRYGYGLRRTAGHSAAANRRFFWYSMGLVFFLFALLKVVAVLPATGNLLRELAKSDGFYVQRRALQRLTISLFAVFSAAGVGAMLTYGLPRRFLLPLTGTVILMAFAAIRWVSLHAVDHALAQAPWLVPAIEIAGAMLAIWPTLPRAREPRKHRRNPHEMRHPGMAERGR